jgi:alpha-tubulin suppressor-like RCC1 family protein
VCGGEFHSVALLSNSTIVGWGGNSEGQLDTPVDAIGSKRVAAIACGGNATYALMEDGTVLGWGADGDVQVSSGGPAVGWVLRSCVAG